nr:helix-turn-helix domain-containing protein [Kibdelosporangium sp. MJ126-NF4]CEL23343.1 hypothetical protein [Kibdelosporangium sp. MJ126-NF4]CTQ94505.1 hypothetical protein [Kibdelosporangium sp. MJ126-NF4]
MTASQDELEAEPKTSDELRGSLRKAALRNALEKRALGVPTYTVPEAAVLLSISQEYMYRLIQADAFPALHMRVGGKQGRYVVPAQAVETLLKEASNGNNCVDVAAWTDQWHNRTAGGVA